jgi:hypothetical protein
MYFRNVNYIAYTQKMQRSKDKKIILIYFNAGVRTDSILQSQNKFRTITPCGGGVEYLHRNPASRRRRRKGTLESETVKCGHESHGTHTQK